MYAWDLAYDERAAAQVSAARQLNEKLPCGAQRDAVNMCIAAFERREFPCDADHTAPIQR